jgi:hypothetical protein
MQLLTSTRRRVLAVTAVASVLFLIVIERQCSMKSTNETVEVPSRTKEWEEKYLTHKNKIAINEHIFLVPVHYQYTYYDAVNLRVFGEEVKNVGRLAFNMYYPEFTGYTLEMSERIKRSRLNSRLIPFPDDILKNQISVVDWGYQSSLEWGAQQALGKIWRYEEQFADPRLVLFEEHDGLKCYVYPGSVGQTMFCRGLRADGDPIAIRVEGGVAVPGQSWIDPGICELRHGSMTTPWGGVVPL